ncbi:transcriptional repressor LexA [Desulfofundulus thermobenzoicus]|uniref:LexA repressor n=1 Tax=Desulfofundulus thermobenzoicus TaxID=29376 RepID=A0A6N7IS63_9FIRM|nr:transcriptional repressor LexA [Desulfofundulus thermobenzoicus]HHW43137.1 transcriptional repressor LexA [Desulfotomaculum sp.]
MKITLTPREETILAVIRENVRLKGYPPSVREIGEVVGLKSSSTVHSYLKRLEKKGLLRRDPTKPRALELLERTTNMQPSMRMVPLLGRVAAGEPILAVENREELIPLPVSFTGEGEFFMLKVRGDSMIEAGILDGDMVVVRRQPAADNGDIVVALLEDEATVKRFFRENDHVRLQPENRTMSPIRVKNPVILGKVVGLLRKF